jgi:proline iminopeptidase
MAMTPEPTTRPVRIGRHRVITYSYGDEGETVFLLNGGPGLPCNYLREPMLRLLEHGFRVVTYDQLGCGASDKPKDPALWTISRYVDEVETVRQALGLGRGTSSAIPGVDGWASNTRSPTTMP